MYRVYTSLSTSLRYILLVIALEALATPSVRVSLMTRYGVTRGVSDEFVDAVQGEISFVLFRSVQ